MNAHTSSPKTASIIKCCRDNDSSVFMLLI